MAEALKLTLGEDAVIWLADSLRRADGSFDHDGFCKAAKQGLGSLGLKQRAFSIACCLGEFLPHDFALAAQTIARSLEPAAPVTGETGFLTLRYLVHDSFIEQFGLDDPEVAFALQSEVTRRGTCEFSIRAFLLRHPEKTYMQMQTWARSEDPHLRRLASEGMRPRLPWAQRLPKFVENPEPVIALLECLRDDPVRYVQRSVANNLNDISKDHPDHVAELCAKWLSDAGDARRWIVKHATRDLIKKGHRRSLEIMGGGGKPCVSVSNFSYSPSEPRIGDRLAFEFNLTGLSRAAQELIVDFRIHFRKANGRTSPKVFKLARISLSWKESVTLRSSVSLANMTTRKHNEGTHVIELQINGVRFPLGEFFLCSEGA